MFLEGKIKTYNEERGFGFIEIVGESKDLFFHIKDFPNKNVPPKVGESLKFRKVQDGDKFKADNIVRLDLKTETPRHTPQSRALQNKPRVSRQRQHTQEKKNNFTSYIGILIILGLAYAVYNKYQDWQSSKAPTVEVQRIVEEPHVQQNFSCDGRQHCSQMGSYEEALYFVQNCPNTKMDGDGDGIPCENDSRW
ncbi:cold shock domain-containing protein [Acinetobacter sp. ASP199]|uniref:cold shock domain-containing protein n=1 Tax=unclassified Acinetobacter TaxID=196816 RepID=UPI001F62242F|nr:cold shock domain-containing protein [Acinetobacter sp. ASP199]UNT58652.1 cold shock domain-containing protein [Acinetobacter sp. ASP199]